MRGSFLFVHMCSMVMPPSPVKLYIARGDLKNYRSSDKSIGIPEIAMTLSQISESNMNVFIGLLAIHGEMPSIRRPM